MDGLPLFTLDAYALNRISVCTLDYYVRTGNGLGKSICGMCSSWDFGPYGRRVNGEFLDEAVQATLITNILNWDLCVGVFGKNWDVYTPQLGDGKVSSVESKEGRFFVERELAVAGN